MSNMKRLFRTLLACSVATFVLAGSAYAEESPAQEGGWGALAALGTLIYSPTKVVYAGLGLITGGLGYVLSGGDKDVFDTVITASVRGDYVLRPAHLRGEDPLEFIGRNPSYDQMDVAAQAPASEDGF